MIGAIAGDIVGSPYEFRPHKSVDFPLLRRESCFDTAERVLAEAEKSAAVTHDHAEGIRGAQAVALAVFRARNGTPKAAIRSELESRFGYDLSRTIDGIRPAYAFDETCQGTVPEALIAFLEAASTEDAVRLAVSLGGDADTLAAIAGSVAEPFHRDLPERVVASVRLLLPAELLDVIDAFGRAYPLMWIGPAASP